MFSKLTKRSTLIPYPFSRREKGRHNLAVSEPPLPPGEGEGEGVNHAIVA
jgi:hypothetical protein